MYNEYLGRRVRATWEDIVAWGGWTSSEKFEKEGQKPWLMETIGTVTWITDSCIVISATRSLQEEANDTEYNQHMTIPLGCLTSLELI